MLSKLELEPKYQGRRNQKTMTLGPKTCLPKGGMSKGSPCNWCDADVDVDADRSKKICRPPP